mgnify:CR=1 FL=1
MRCTSSDYEVYCTITSTYLWFIESISLYCTARCILYITVSNCTYTMHRNYNMMMQIEVPGAEMIASRTEDLKQGALQTSMAKSL